MNSATQSLVTRYLRDLERALHDLPGSRRREMVDDIRAHIDEAATSASEADVRTILDQVGDPESIAAEARERFGIERQKAGILEGGAIALLLVGGVILPGVGWIIGAVLLWLSRVWTVRDKLIGTLLVPGGLASAFFLGLFATGTSSSCETVKTVPGGSEVGICSAETIGPGIWSTLLLVFLILAPIATAIYLGRRAWRSR
jgi:hypothetical protein